MKLAILGILLFSQGCLVEPPYSEHQAGLKKIIHNKMVFRIWIYSILKLPSNNTEKRYTGQRKQQLSLRSICYQFSLNEYIHVEE